MKAFKEHKIVLAGPTGAGKTTAIRSVSEITPVSTEAYASDEVAKQKNTTTVALDYGELSLSELEVLRLYGTPGQERFSHMWSMLCNGALGVIFLFDNSRPDPLADMDFYLEKFAPYTQGQQMVIGVTRNQLDSGPDVDDYYARLQQRGWLIPVMSVDTREGADVLMLLDTLMLCIEYPATAESRR